MTARRRSRRPWRTGAVLLVTVAIALCSGSCATFSSDQAVGYCAIMPDSVGLYVDNPVSQMGYPIGKVTAVTPSARSVQVDFTISSGRALPGDVKAVIRSSSILADRSLELVGNYDGGSRLSSGGCIPLSRSVTPKSLSEVIGASTTFVDAITPAGSNNLGDVIAGVDKAVHGLGPGANTLLATTSSVLDSPDQAIGDLGTATANLAELTSTLADLEPTLKGVFSDLDVIAPDLVKTGWGASRAFNGLTALYPFVADVETQLGPQVQQLFDALSVALRKLSPRAPFYASLLNVTPRLINGLANLANNHDFTLQYRPPLYRLRTPDGVLQCNVMNASLPGSCANVNGTPYAVDVALLQYVLTQAANR